MLNIAQSPIPHSPTVPGAALGAFSQPLSQSQQSQQQQQQQQGQQQQQQQQQQLRRLHELLAQHQMQQYLANSPAMMAAGRSPADTRTPKPDPKLLGTPFTTQAWGTPVPPITPGVPAFSPPVSRSPLLNAPYLTPGIQSSPLAPSGALGGRQQEFAPPAPVTMPVPARTKGILQRLRLAEKDDVKPET